VVYEDLARIFMMVGEHDAAVAQIEGLLAVPSPTSVPMLRTDPIWDPLRDHPRFQALLER
jgi:serine/threonine-protein kinase